MLTKRYIRVRPVIDSVNMIFTDNTEKDENPVNPEAIQVVTNDDSIGKLMSHWEQELGKVDNYGWGGVRQNNADDKLTNFIYKTESYDDLMKNLEEKKVPARLHQYAITRWYNFWSSQIVEKIFKSYNNVNAGPTFHHYIDFTINGLHFDLKTSNYPNDLKGEPYNRDRMIEWFYQSQSGGKRHHLKNRLFIVVSDWKDKRNFTKIKQAVDAYMDSYNQEKLYKNTSFGQTIYADIILIK